jgi:signal transduction histidine kinase/DNA-binding response OmpR family regulator
MNTPPPPVIVIVDDDPMQVQLLEKILANENYKTIGYTDNRKALEQIPRILPDLILLDLTMPEIDGFEVCRRLKNNEPTRHIPVIFVTASTEQATESKGFELGAVDYITKPYNPIITKARVRNHIELKQHRDSLTHLVHERTAERDISLQQFQDLVEKSMVGIAIFQDDQIVYQNPEIKRTVGDLATMIREKDYGLIHPDHKAQLKLAYQSILKGISTSAEADVQILSNGQTSEDQQYKWVNCRASTFNYNGRETILINLMDITHTKALEKLLLNRNKMASLGRIAAGMAHEIRNPLTGITSYLYSLEQICEAKTVVPKDIDLMNEIIGQLKLASHKVEAVIKRVLDFSKPTTPKMVEVDVNQCLTNVLQLTALTLRKAGIEVTTALSAKLPRCYGDMALIEQLFLNLIQNAGRALKRSDGKKKIEVASNLQNNHINISVSDSGPGVSLEIKDKIFDPFFTTSSDGSGIGLSIAQRIVTDHNGLLTVSEGKFGGAHFTVSLPIEKRKYPR